MKVVVTGATGHLGTYVVHRLAAGGHQVVAASRSGTLPEPPFGATRANGGVTPLALDIEDESSVERLAAELSADVALVHLAGWYPAVTGNSSIAERSRLLATNVLGTQRVLDAARSGVRAIVYASSFEVYGIPPSGALVTEADSPQPFSDYGVTKLAGEDHLMAFAGEERVRAVALRLPAIYGPGELAARALPNFLRAVARAERPRVFGEGSDRRDQLHAADAALGVELALRCEAHGLFNLSDGEPHSVWRLACAALAAAGVDAEPERVPAERPSFDFHMSIDKARRELGFAPRIALLAGMTEELAWLKTLTR